MNSKDLKIVAGSFITESKLTKESKKQLLNFIQHEACDHQIMALMLDGKIAKLDEQSKQIVEERFSNKFNEEVLQERVWKNVLGLVFAPTLWALWRGLEFSFSTAARKCGAIGITIQRDVCMAQARLNMWQKRLQILQKAAGDCSKANNPGKCKDRASKQINKAKDQVAKYSNRLNKLKVELTKKGKMGKYGLGKAKAEA